MAITKIRADLQIKGGSISGNNLSDGSVNANKLTNDCAGKGVVRNGTTKALDLDINSSHFAFSGNILSLDGNVTLGGNAFNAANQLVKLDGDSKLPAAADGSNIGGVVHSLRADAETGLVGNVTLASGTNVSLSQVGNTITVNASAGGGPGGADGQIQFKAGGNFGGDPGLFWDNVGKRLGVGVIPSSLFHVSGAGPGGAVSSTVQNTGAGPDAPASLRLVSENITQADWSILTGFPGFGGNFLIYNGVTANFLTAATDGKFGLDVASPAYKLDVAGDVNASGVYRVAGAQIAIANLSNGADIARLSTLTTKGDLYAATAAATVTRVGVGTNGQVLAADSAQTAGVRWVTLSTSGGGYATVVVAAATGTAATDTSNIQSAIDTVAATGGTVVLREGVYVVNSSIIPKSNVTIIGQGREATILRADAALNTFVVNTSTQVSYAGIQDMTIDGNWPARAAQADPDVYFNAIQGFLLRVRVVNACGLTEQTQMAGRQGVVYDCEFNAGNVPSVATGSLLKTSGWSVERCVINIPAAGAPAFGQASAFSPDFSAVSVRDCLYSGGLVSDAMLKLGAGGDYVIAGNTFAPAATATAPAISMGGNAVGRSIAIVGNVNTIGQGDTGASVPITITATGSGKVTVTGNAGFSAYTAGAGVAAGNA